MEITQDLVPNSGNLNPSKEKEEGDESSQFNPYHAKLTVPGSSTRYNKTTGEFVKTTYLSQEKKRTRGERN